MSSYGQHPDPAAVARAIEVQVEAVTTADIDSLGRSAWYGRYLDETALPPELRETARQRVANAERVSKADAGQSFSVLLAALLMPIGLLLVAHGAEFGQQTAVIGGVLALVGALVAIPAGRWIFRDPWKVTEAEFRQISAATRDLKLPLSPTIVDLLDTDRSSRWQDIKQQWKARSPRREAKLVYVATSILNDIRNSPAWQDEVFDEHRVRLDLTAAEREIYEYAARLWEIDSTLVAPTGNDPAVTTQWTHHRSALDEAWKILIDRVAALHTYREGLRPIESTLRDLAAVRSMTTTSTELSDILTSSARADIATDHTRNLDAELPELAANLTAQLEFLRRAAIHQEALATPLPVLTPPASR